MTQVPASRLKLIPDQRLPTSIQLKRHPRRKHLAYRVLEGGCLEVLAPAAWSLRRIRSVLADNEAAIRRAVAKRPQTEVVQEIQWVLGQPYGIQVDPSLSPINLGLRESGDRSQPRLFLAPAEPETVAYQNFCKAYFRSKARALFEQRLVVCAKRFPGLLPKHALGRIGTPSTRWGSCSSLGNINLNALLLQYSIACIDSVIVHELCHLFEMNHSPKFYRLMDQVLPEWRGLESQFKSPLPKTWADAQVYLQHQREMESNVEHSITVTSLVGGI